MADARTKPTRAGVKAFVDAVENPERRRDCRTVMKLMKAATGVSPQLWGPSIIGYGSYHYKYDSGREGDWPVTGVSPRKQALSVYIMPGFARYEALLKKLGPHKTGVSCLYIKRLSDIDLDVLDRLIRESVKHMASRRTA